MMYYSIQYLHLYIILYTHMNFLKLYLDICPSNSIDILSIKRYLKMLNNEIHLQSNHKEFNTIKHYLHNSSFIWSHYVYIQQLLSIKDGYNEFYSNIIDSLDDGTFILTLWYDEITENIYISLLSNNKIHQFIYKKFKKFKKIFQQQLQQKDAIKLQEDYFTQKIINELLTCMNFKLCNQLILITDPILSQLSYEQFTIFQHINFITREYSLYFLKVNDDDVLNSNSEVNTYVQCKSAIKGEEFKQLNEQQQQQANDVKKVVKEQQPVENLRIF